eukprot:TRINITY_DN589_c0_g1_i2.p1 TRINITY_DN589_c0_g1~~TRINITY_DN589_c0_g1_i2.p1  ORF type:complete len:261 (+),score=55.05 TRINITY_DN589_c0_g1_i2:109-891(+)
MLETYSLNSWTILCPQPRRVIPSLSSHVSVFERELEDEQCTLELTNIFQNRIPTMNQYSRPMTAPPERDAQFTPFGNFEDEVLPTKDDIKSTQDNGLRCSNPGLPDLFINSSNQSSASKPQPAPLLRRPALGLSMPLLPEPCCTPPMRAHNPIPMNTSFTKTQVRESPEFGLLSVSPPDSFGDDDRLARRERVFARLRRGGRRSSSSSKSKHASNNNNNKASDNNNNSESLRVSSDGNSRMNDVNDFDDVFGNQLDASWL